MLLFNSFFKILQTVHVSSAFAQQRALLHWPTACAQSGGETPSSHPECVEWQQRGGGECECMGPTVWSVRDNVIMPVRGSFPCWTFKKISVNSADTPISLSPTVLLFWLWRRRGGEFVWPAGAGRSSADNKWQRSDHNKRHKVRKIFIYVQAERIGSYFMVVSG